MSQPLLSSPTAAAAAAAVAPGGSAEHHLDAERQESQGYQTSGASVLSKEEISKRAQDQRSRRSSRKPLLAALFARNKGPAQDGEKGAQDPYLDGGEEQQPRSKASAISCCLPRSPILRTIVIIAVVVVMLLIILLATLLTLLHRSGVGNAADAAFPSPAFSESPVVDVSYGQYQGVTLENGITQWLGLRYSRAPVGEYRFAAPAPPLNFTGVQMANKTVKGCVGVGPQGNSTNEDCLSLDVYAPSSATNISSLPVFVFIPGGGLDSATDHPNCSDLILSAQSNMVAVTITYRAGAYGFLASSQLQANASLNNGYKDQRYALQWVKQHISKFGGNPDHVTLGGQSAGAGSAVGQLLAYGGDNSNLFQAAIIQSQSMGPVRTVDEAQYQFDNITQRLGCDDADDQIACLRAIPNDVFLDHVTNEAYPDGPGGAPIYPYNPVVDSDFIRDVPMAAFRDGNFARVPTIFGDVTDEGTIFTSRKIANEDEAATFLANNFPTINETTLTEYTSLYNLSSNGSSPFWHKAASAYGETRYTCAGMQLPTLMRANGFTKVWNYRFNTLDPKYAADGYGVSHGVDVSALFGPVYGGPESYKTTNKNIVPVLQGYWTSFIQTQDPNAKRAPGTPEWGLWDGSSQRLRLEPNTTAMEAVPATQLQRCNFWGQVAAGLEQ